MFCRLCINDCEDCKELFDAEGQQNEIYEVTSKYFEAQLAIWDSGPIENGHKFSRTICERCWSHIDEFHKYQKEILAAHENYQRFIQFEEVVKLEAEIDFDMCNNTDSLKEFDAKDPVEVTEKIDNISEILKEDGEQSIADSDRCDDYSHDTDYSSEDDKPLINRVIKTKSIRKQNLKTRTKSKRKRGTEECSNKKKRNRRGLQQKTLEHDAFIAEHWKKEFSCELCDHISENFSTLRAHFRDLHNDDHGYVSCCQNKFFHRFHLVEHIKLHINPEHFKCNICGKLSTNRRNLKNHMKSMHSGMELERKYECNICHKRFAKPAILRGHMDIHATGSKDFVCEICQKGYVLETQLRAHLRNVHAEKSVCDICGKSFSGRYMIKRHLLEHEGIMKPKWPCDQCDAQLHSKYSLGRHKRIAHNDGSTAYVCGICGKISLNEDALRSHKRRIHEMERKHKCSICEKAFKTSIVLREHMTTHTGEELYTCPHCPKKFKVNANMHHHRKRVHPKEWAESRMNRPAILKADVKRISNEIVL